MRVLGFEAVVGLGFDDRGLLERIGARPGDEWLPAAVVALDGACPSFTPQGEDWPDTDDPVLRADRRAWQEGVERGAPDQDIDPVPDAVRAQPEPPRASAATSAATSSTTWSDLLFERSSGRSKGGFTASPDPLPPGVLHEALEAASDAATRDWDWGPGIRLLAAVERIDDIDNIDDGLYAWDLATKKLHLLSPGRHLAHVQKSFFYPQAVTRVDTCNVAVFCVVDYPALLAAEGARGLRHAQLRLGALMQASAVACAAREVFFRPCRSFDPDGLTDLLGLAADETVAYLCLAGRSRFTDLMLDMRP